MQGAVLELQIFVSVEILQLERHVRLKRSWVCGKISTNGCIIICRSVTPNVADELYRSSLERSMSLWE